MNTGLLVPAAAAVFVALGSTVVRRRLRPVVATWVIAGLAVVTAAAAAAAAALISVAWAAHVPWIAERVGWCRSFAARHDSAPWFVGIPATIAVFTMLVAAGRAWRRGRRNGTFSPMLTVVDEERAIAYSVNTGEIVVSSGMLRALDSPERRVLLAHERAHVRHRHYRFLRVVATAAAAFPLLRRLRNEVRFATERWADEEAAREVGDRRLVARAIARAALAQAAPATALGLADWGVAARVEALLSDEISVPGPGRLAFAASVAVTAVIAASSAQVHHFVEFLAHVCGL